MTDRNWRENCFAFRRQADRFFALKERVSPLEKYFLRDMILDHLYGLYQLFWGYDWRSGGPQTSDPTLRRLAKPETLSGHRCFMRAVFPSNSAVPGTVSVVRLKISSLAARRFASCLWSREKIVFGEAAESGQEENEKEERTKGLE